MFQKFTATAFNIDKATKTIYFSFSQDVDESSVTAESLYIQNAHGVNIKRTAEVDGSNIIVHIDESITPNEEYEIVLSRKICSILDEQIAYNVTKTFIYESSVRNTIKITSPSDHEDIGTSLKLKWKEIIFNGDEKVNNYKIEIAHDHLFENIVISTNVPEKKSFNAAEFKINGQYYVRIRAQKNDEDFGAWSETTTFTVSGIKDDKEETEDEEVFVKELEILTVPENGVTPKSFIIEFDSNIDPESITEDDIYLIKRRI